jgi:hypothetical protein
LFTFFRRFGLYASNLAVAAHLLGREQQTNSKGQSGDRIQFYRTNVANKNESNNKFPLQIKTVSLNSALKTRINQNNNRKMLIRKNALSSKLTKYPVKEKLHPLLQYSKVELCMRDIHRDRSNFDLYACYSITQNLAFSFNYWVRGLTVRNTEMLFISDFLFRFYYYYFFPVSCFRVFRRAIHETYDDSFEKFYIFQIPYQFLSLVTFELLNWCDYR